MALVLIVDDDPLVGSALAMLVKGLGHAHTLVCDGVAALAFLRVERADLVILDVRMPGMSGFDVLRGMNGDVPVIMFSADKDARDEALSLGAVAFVEKHDPDGLEAKIREYLDHKPACAASPGVVPLLALLCGEGASLTSYFA